MFSDTLLLPELSHPHWTPQVCAIDQSRKLRRYTINGSQLTQAFESKGALLKYPVKWLHASKGKWVPAVKFNTPGCTEDVARFNFWE